MKLDLDLLAKAYFYFDEPVPYIVDGEKVVNIYPVKLKDSEVFMASMSVLTINKNELPSVDIIQMSYLEFLFKIIFAEEKGVDMVKNILKICLKIDDPGFYFGKDKKPFILDKKQSLIISAKHFENIRRIILYQNIPDYDDSYIDPDLRKAIEETKMMKARDVDFPNVERRMAIITAHCGISKEDQKEMTMRSHNFLFDEVAGEVEYTTVFPIAAFGGKGKDINWIFKKKSDKLKEYTTDVNTIKDKFGANGVSNQTSNTSKGNSYEKIFEAYSNK